MSDIDIVVFEDDLVARLQPISLARPSYAITCGAARLMDWLPLLSPSVRGLVRPHLEQIQEVDYPQLMPAESAALAAPDSLIVNSRLVPSRGMFEKLRALVREPRAVTVRHQGHLAAAWLPAAAGIDPLRSRDELTAFEASLQSATNLPLELPLFTYPHDVIRYHLETLVGNLEFRLQRGKYREIADGVFLGPGAKLSPHVVAEAADGPIVLEQGATVGPFSLLRGPLSLGAHARVNEHAVIKDHVAAGHTTKIGGEVEATVIEPYSNKQHHGFLGHSYIGSWINLGAGTCNSDLKNTYGKVNILYGDQKTETGMQFVGCIMGDYAKTAINTGIFTGKIIGVCSMLYGYVTTNVPSFVNYARLFGQVSELPADVMISTQRRMFSRRNVEQRPCDAQLIRDMFELTRYERQLPDEQLML